MWNAIYHGILSWAKAHGVAMAGRQGLQVTVETDRVLVVRRLPIRMLCPECGRETEMVSLQDAATITGMIQAMPSAAEEQGWHFREGEQETLVCLDSLLKAL